MSSDKHIKEVVEKLVKLLPVDFDRMPPGVQAEQLERVLSQISGIAWLLVVEGRWDQPIGEWVQEKEGELMAAQWACRQQQRIEQKSGERRARRRAMHQPQGAARDA